ncbi:MAG TPA: aminoacyl-tRNA hydrolase [Thiotrichales bacterium]|nr:aminoacyl-tRNA hydrolase [Thiotrichales bacterium]
MLRINEQLVIPDQEIEIQAIRARGPGGQNVNKVSSAIQLRFDIVASTLPGEVKQRLLKMHDRRISREGVVVIKAQRSRSQERNREAARERLRELIQRALERPRLRRPTRPSRAARQRRLDNKARRGRIKALRRRITPDE